MIHLNNQRDARFATPFEDSGFDNLKVLDAGCDGGSRRRRWRLQFVEPGKRVDEIGVVMGYTAPKSLG